MIKWTEADVLKAFEEAMTPKSPSPEKGGNGRVLIEQMKRMAKQGQTPKQGEIKI